MHPTVRLVPTLQSTDIFQACESFTLVLGSLDSCTPEKVPQCQSISTDSVYPVCSGTGTAHAAGGWRGIPDSTLPEPSAYQTPPPCSRRPCRQHADAARPTGGQRRGGQAAIHIPGGGGEVCGTPRQAIRSRAPPDRRARYAGGGGEEEGEGDPTQPLRHEDPHTKPPGSGGWGCDPSHSGGRQGFFPPPACLYFLTHPLPVSSNEASSSL